MKLGSTDISRLYVGANEVGKVYLGLTEIFKSWTPQKLFTAGEQGVWYDPSDLTTMFQDTFGSTPVTTAGQTVALMLDKSQGLAQGEATDAIGWVDAGFGSFSTDGTSVTFEKTVAGGTDQTYSSAQFAVTAGTRYEIEVNVAQYFGPFDVFFSFITNSRGDGFAVTSAGVQKFFLIPSATATLSLNFRTTTTGGGASVSVASVREAPLGNHATQATAASRPVYAYHPEGGIRNLLVQTENFADAAWGKTNVTVVANSATFFGSATADLVYPATSGTLRAVNQTTGGGIVGVNNTYSVYLKPSGVITKAYIYNVQGNSASYFDLDAQTVLSTGVNGTVSASIEDMGGGISKCTVVSTNTFGANRYCYTGPCDADGSTNVTANGTDGIYIWGAQLELGSIATNYQRVGNEYDVTEAGVESLSYLSFDGAGDHMVTAYGSIFSELTRAFAYRANGANFFADDDDNVNFGGLYTPTDGNLSFLVDGGAEDKQISALGGWTWGANQVAVASISSAREMKITGSGNDATPVTSASPLTELTGITIGAAAGGLISLDGRIYSVVDLSRVVTEDERASLTSYLAVKSGITL